VIRIIRRIKPDVIITHRSCDYHADHRAAGQVVTDAAYLIAVPRCCPDAPPLRETPVFCCSYDHFKKPVPFQADASIAIDEVLQEKIQMILFHESQVLEWIPWISGMEGFDKDKLSLEQKKEIVIQNWLWLDRKCAEESSAFLKSFYGRDVKYAESFELSEYGRRVTPDEFQKLMMGEL